MCGSVLSVRVGGGAVWRVGRDVLRQVAIFLSLVGSKEARVAVVGVASASSLSTELFVELQISLFRSCLSFVAVQLFIHSPLCFDILLCLHFIRAYRTRLCE